MCTVICFLRAFKIDCGQRLVASAFAWVKKHTARIVEGAKPPKAQNHRMRTSAEGAASQKLLNMTKQKGGSTCLNMKFAECLDDQFAQCDWRSLEKRADTVNCTTAVWNKHCVIKSNEAKPDMCTTHATEATNRTKRHDERNANY